MLVVPASSASLFFVRCWIYLLVLFTLTAFAAPPAILTQPQKRSVVEGSNHTFAVAASGSAPLSYQWRKNGSNLANQTNTTLALTAIQTNDAGGYSVVVTNAEGSITSAVAQLTVRLASDPAYPTPQGGWAYLFAGNAAAGELTAALDGTWNHEYDSWSGDGRGAGNGLPGGVSSTNGILTIEDAVATTSGGTFNNRRYYFTHNLAQETAVTNANNLLNDGVTLSFRARLTPAADPQIELTNAPSGLVNNADGKGMFGIRQAGGSGMLVSFSLGQASEDLNTTTNYNFAAAGLHMNNLNGDAPTAAVDPGEAGTVNLLPLAPASFREFWITIQGNGADPGTHRVNIYADGNKTPATFNITAGSGYDGPGTNYLALGLGSTAQRGAVDVDFFGYQSGVLLPAGFNEPVGIVAQPTTQYVALGQAATFNVGLTGTPPYNIQWYRNGAVIPGATSGNYTTPPVVPGDAGAQFMVVVSNEINTVTSAPPAQLQLLTAPIITTQPASLTVTNGDPATFNVVASSAVTPTYQWYYTPSHPQASRPVGLQVGETNATLTIASATTNDAGSYTVILTNPGGSVTSGVAALTIVLFDYGDAADPTFPTLRASNGAAHRIVPGIFLGSTIDAETDGQPGTIATGDDTTASDDEDGVNFLTPLLVGQTATLQIIATTNGLLNAWLDYDRNGTWSNPGEQIFTNTPLATGTNTLNIRVPGAATAGPAPARFRFSTVSGLTTTGHAPDGEVEDHTPTITPVADLALAQSAYPNPVAVGAPLTCAITITNTGPSTATAVVTTNAIPAGTTFQTVVASQGSCLLLGGELTCDVGTLGPGASATITLTLTPTAAGQITNTVRTASTAVDLFPGNNVAVATATALQAPMITTPPQNLTVTNGSAASLSVTASGSPPMHYQWRRDGTNMVGQTNAILTFANAQPADAGNYTVRITNLVGNIVSAPATLTVLVPPSIIAQPQSQTNLAGSTAVLNVSATGSAPLGYQWTLNGANVAGQTSATLTLVNLQPSDAGNYRVLVSNAAGVVTSSVAALTIIALDFGDAPDSYRTVRTNNGARHRMVPGIRLGAAVDFEPDAGLDGGQSIALTGAADDTTGTDDEDGITFTTPLRAGQNATLTAVASTNGFLNAWLDYNGNGTWGDSGEQILTNRNVATGTNTISIPMPGNLTAGPSYARFRFNAAGSLGPEGEASDGEVEDYALTLEGVSDLRIHAFTQTNPIATGGTQVYSFVLTNVGPSSATGVTLTHQLPAGLNFLNANISQGGCTYSAGTILCTVGTMVPGSRVTVQMQAFAVAAGQATNTLSLAGTQFDPSPGNNALQLVTSILDLPAIQNHPQNQTVTNGGTAVFMAGVSGTTLRYQWLLNGTPVTGATNATHTVTNAQPAQAGSYILRATNELGAAFSDPAILTILGPATITAQPQSQTVLAGTNVTLSVTASGSPPITYQWELDGADLPGQTASTLLLPNVQTSQSGAYRVRVTNPIGTVNSAIAMLTVLEPPTFILQPESSTNAVGSSVTLTAQVTGTAPLTYQWYFQAPGAGAPGAMAGATNTSLTQTNLQTNRTGFYSLVASNLTGPRTSAVAAIAVYEMDFGDAPEANGYPTTLAFNGARHRLLPGVRLGLLADFETNGLPNATATGDDTSSLDDEDGVLFPAALLVGQNALVPVIASTNGFLDAWIDFNGNGNWSDPGEQVLASHSMVVGTNQVPFAISPGALPGQRFVRCRFSTSGGLAYDGFAPSGEVEDYRVTLQPACDLAVALQAVTNSVPHLGQVVYLMWVTNRGPNTATAVILTNFLSPTMSYVAGTPSQGYCTDIGSNAQCPVDNIPPGGVVNIMLTVRANAPGTYPSTAIAIANEPDLNLADNTATVATAVVLPTTHYTNAASIPVADATGAGPGVGNPYPSTLMVSGYTTAVQKVTVRLNNLSHPFAKDLDVLLVSPQGQSALLMSDAGAGALGGVTLTLDDAAELSLPSAGVIATGIYKPSDYGTGADFFPPPAPAGPYVDSLSVFNGTDPNGPWGLYTVDGQPVGQGTIAGGWQLSITTADPIADLVLIGQANPSPVPVSSNLVYTLALTNRGPAIADGVVLTDLLPPGVTFISASSTRGSCTQQTGLVSCAVGTLAVGAGAQATITVRPVVVGDLTNSASASANRLDPVAANHLVRLVTPARLLTDMAIGQALSTNLVQLGQSLSCTLHVTNRGPNMAGNIIVSNLLPEGVLFVSATPGQGSCTNFSGVVVCELGTLASGARTQVAVVMQPTGLGSLTNRASVLSDDVEANPTNNVTVATATVNTAADLALTLAASPNPAPVGGALVYDLTVTNRGPAYAYEVWLTNTLPAGVSFISAIAPDGFCAHNGGVVTCSLGILTAGSSTPVSITVSPGGVGRFTNSAVVRSAAIDAVPANNVASVAVDAALPPVILTQPLSVAVTNGASATFTVAASGTAPLRYQWQFNGADIASATNTGLTISNVSVGAVGSYRVRVSNIVSAVFSQGASLAVVVPPSISNLGDQATEEDTLTAAVAFTVSDPDGAAGAITLSGAASEVGSGLPSSLVMSNGFIFGGSGGNRTLQVVPATNRFGSAVITISARDADGQVATDVFVLTVSPVNDAPSLADLFNRSILEDGVLAIPIVIGDAESPVESLSVSVTTNTALFPPGGVTLTGTGTNRLLILQPAANQSGQASLTVSVSDTNGASVSDTFTVSVAAVNDPPTVSVPGGVSIDEDAGPQSIALTGLSSGAGDEVQSLVVSVTSSNLALIPQPVVRFTNGSSVAWIDFASVSNGHGVSGLSVRVDDGGTSNNVTVRSFSVAVNPVNDLPVMSAIADQVIDEGSATGPLAFSVRDVESSGAALVVAAGSSDTNLVPAAGLLLSGPVGGQGSAPADWSLVVRPATNRFGVATVSVSVTDTNGGSSVRSFQVTVRQLPPVILAQPVGLTVTNGGVAGFTVTAGGSGLGYQWSFSPAGPQVCWPAGGIAGATNSTLTISNAQVCHAGGYWVVVSNGAGQVTSAQGVLRVLVGPMITGISRAGSQAQISFTSVSNLSYTVEFTDSLGAPAWGALPVAAGTGGVLSVTDPAASVPGRVYRVRVE